MFRYVISRYANILHIRFQATFSSLPPDALNRISPANFFRRLLKVVLYTAGRLLPNFFSRPHSANNLSGKIWLYVVSQNNVDSLRFLKDGLSGTELVAGQNKQIGRYNREVTRLSLRWKFFYTIRYFIPLLAGLYKIHGPKAFRFFDLIFISIGYFEAYVRHLKKHKPKAVIFANDHNDDARAMLLAAKACKIPTIYLQHASVSTDFPPLDFDLSLLEGLDALDKYKLCGPVSGTVKLVGMPKADQYLINRSCKTTIETIGICSNILDNYEGLKQTLTSVAAHFPDLKIIFRPHPNDLRDYSFFEFLGKNHTVSDAKAETAFEYLKQTDLLLAGDSSILLEAAFLDIPGIYYRFGDSNFTYDYYGYVKNSLVYTAESASDLLKLISELIILKPKVVHHSGYYNASIGTEWEGKSSELAIKEIVAFLKINQ